MTTYYSSSCVLLWTPDTAIPQCGISISKDYLHLKDRDYSILTIHLHTLFFLSYYLLLLYLLCLQSMYWLFRVISYNQKAFWWEMAPAAAAHHWGGCYSLCWWPRSRNPAPGVPCRHFHQWKNSSWKICEKGRNSPSKFIPFTNMEHVE